MKNECKGDEKGMKRGCKTTNKKSSQVLWMNRALHMSTYRKVVGRRADNKLDEGAK